MTETKEVAEEHQPQAPVTLPPVTNPHGVSSVYANNLEIATSSIDVRLLFNEIIMERGNIAVERRANVVMSIDHFRAMMQVLARSQPAQDAKTVADAKTAPDAG